MLTQPFVLSTSKIDAGTLQVSLLTRFLISPPIYRICSGRKLHSMLLSNSKQIIKHDNSQGRPSICFGRLATQH